jgi:energy-coupling factor transporter transmembrane protein EcfT
MPSAPPIQVVIQKSRGNSAAILALFCVALGVITCCLPIIPWVFALLAIVFALLGILLALMRGGTGLAYSLAALFLAFLPMLPAFFIGAIFFGSTTPKPTSSPAYDGVVNTPEPLPIEKPQGAEQIKQEEEKHSEVKTDSDVANPPESSPAKKSDQLPPDKAKSIPHAPSLKTPVRISDVEVTVERITVEKVRVKDFGESLSEEPHLTVRLVVSNLSGVKKLSYSGWAGKTMSFGEHFATLQDEHKNSYKRIHFGLGSRIVGQVNNEDIYPGKMLSDLLIFEVPVDAATMLFLRLPGNTVGVESDFEFSIPISSVQREDRLPHEAEKTPVKTPSVKQKPTPKREIVTRMWTDLTGKHTVEAEFQYTINGVVTLKTKDGRTIKVPLEKISEDDQKWIKERGKHQ